MTTHAAHYREEAQRLRSVAQDRKNVGVKADLEKIADEYDALARQTERLDRASLGPESRGQDTPARAAGAALRRT